MQNEAEESGDDSQNEKTMVLGKVPKTPGFVDDMDSEQGPTAKQPKKAPKTLEFVDTDSDDSDDEQEPTAKHPQKASKASGFVDTDTKDEQGQQPKKVPEYSDDEKGPR